MDGLHAIHQFQSSMDMSWFARGDILANFEAHGWQQQKTTLGSTPVIQEQKSEAAVDKGLCKLDTAWSDESHFERINSLSL